MKLHQLRDVIAVADLGGLRAAARHLNIAQSAITKSVQQLEKELNVPLFERTRRGAVLTPMGTLFLQRARAAAGELSRAQDEINQHRGAGTGSVTVCLSTVPHMAMLPFVIEPFKRRYPDVSLTVLEALGFHRIDAQMRSGAIDAYVGIAPTNKLSSEYQIEPLFKNPRYVIGRAGHSLAGATSLSELTDADWIVSSVTSTDASVAALFRKYGLKVPHRMTFAGSILSQTIFLLNAEMLMIAPKQVLEFAPYAERLVRIPIREEIEAPTMVIVRRAALPLTPAAEHFCDLIRRTSAWMQQSERKRQRR